SHPGKVQGQRVGPEELVRDDAPEAKTQAVFQGGRERPKKAFEISLLGLTQREFIQLQRDELHLPSTADTFAGFFLRHRYPRFVEDRTRAGIGATGQTGVHKKQDRSTLTYPAPGDDKMVARHPKRNN